MKRLFAILTLFILILSCQNHKHETSDLNELNISEAFESLDLVPSLGEPLALQNNEETLDFVFSEIGEGVFDMEEGEMIDIRIKKDSIYITPILNE